MSDILRPSLKIGKHILNFTNKILELFYIQVDFSYFLKISRKLTENAKYVIETTVGTQRRV